MFRNKIISIIILILMACTTSTSLEAASLKTDFNGDGKADLFLRNIFGGNISSWLLNGSQVIQRPSYGSVAINSGWMPMGIKDVNGDRRSDLLWYNTNTGGVSAWFINGGTIAGTASYGALARNAGWAPMGLADFNGDNKADILWYNGYTGTIGAWLLNGSQILQTATYGTAVPNTGWVPIGAKNVNSDKTTDIIWYNTNTGAVSAWFINGGTNIGTSNYGVLARTSGWVPIGLADFNGDGRADILWYNGYTGTIGSWLLNGSQILQSPAYGTATPNSGWTPIGVGDLNGDGKDDLVWYNVNSGSVSAWLISGGATIQSLSLGALNPAQGWVPVGLDDFNGDHRTDILWFNGFTYTTTAWLNNGTGGIQKVSYGSIPQSSVWQIQIPR